jgi:pyruvate/2-oxoglutarate dehydrogenase complex dihydrolipoamide acyltransferase (E2) component
VTAEAAQPPTRPLPIRPRPVSGETTFSYIRRLAVANHMRPLHLRRYLKDPGGGFRLGWLAALAGRPVISLQHALADQEPPAGTASRLPPDARQSKRSKAELFTLIRSDAREHGLSARALADKYGTGKRIVRQALRSPHPAPRKPQPLRGSRIDPFTEIIDGILQAETQAFPPKPRPVISIYRELAATHGADGVSYQMARKYVGRRRAVMQHQSLSPTHQAVTDHDLNRLRDLLDNGHDIEGDNGDGWTLLRRAIHAEADRHARTGEPLHADMTAFLLARGADPLASGMPAQAEAEALGHWLAAEIIRGPWTRRPG